MQRVQCIQGLIIIAEIPSQENSVSSLALQEHFSPVRRNPWKGPDTKYRSEGLGLSHSFLYDVNGLPQDPSQENSFSSLHPPGAENTKI